MGDTEPRMESLDGIERVTSFDWNPVELKRDTGWKEDLARRQAELSEDLRVHQVDLDLCPVCGGRDRTRFAEIHGYPYERCESCAHVYLSRPAAPDAMDRLYSADGDGPVSLHLHVYGDPEIAAIRVQSIARPKVEFVQARVGRTGRWVDIGCGTGEVLQAATTLGWDAVGVESDVHEVGVARDRGCSVAQAYVTPETAGTHIAGALVVSLLNVLEHVPAPVDLIRGLGQAVDPGTWIVVEVPRQPSLSALSNRAFPDLAHRNMYPPDHLHLFSERSMALMLGAGGFVPEAIWVFGQDFTEVVYSLASVAHSRVDIAREFSISDLNAVQRAIDEIGLSDKMIVLARAATTGN